LPIRVIGCRWLPSLRGRPSPSLLEQTLSEPAGGPNVMYKSIAVSIVFPLLCHYQLPLCSRSSALPRSASTHAALGRPGRNSTPLFSAGFLCFGGLEISTPIRPFNRVSHPFSSFGNLILAWADASFQLVSVLRGNYVKMRSILPAPCKPPSSSPKPGMR
jgi:hypothetical protein